ncbi:MAG: FAD-dependent oxidoreductase [Actinobacteria bacterium]|nr:FAD-dependent oxidoreductase [Actinomycetota bacterium]
MTVATPLWQEGDAVTLRPRLEGSHEADVAIVGGGYTGLWTAYYLKSLQPNLRITIVESRHVGFGGSGRNGGWCSAFLPMSPDEMAAEHGREAMEFIQRAMFATVDEVGRVARDEGIDCGFVKGGTLTSASNEAHVDRLRDYVASWHAMGFTDEDVAWQSAGEISSRIAVARTLGGTYSPHCAAIQPWHLVRGLARVLESRGVEIFEDSPATLIEQGRVVTTSGEIRARYVVRAIESFASQMEPTKRSIVPLYSLMVATEPLPDHVWRSLGWSGRETFADGRNMVTYAQRTVDGRIAFGGRGAPYHFGSQIADRFDRHERIHRKLEETVREVFPQVADAKITHRWGGPVGAPRDWHAFANVDHSTGLCAGGGYVGDGVALANLVGRTLAHQIADTGDPLTRSLLVGHTSKKWEVEPMRWLGVNGLLALTDFADRRERRTHQPSKRVLAVRDRLLG